jgi:tetratricopeptide (TPR) repeat protein
MKNFNKIVVFVLTALLLQAGAFFIDPSENAVNHNNLGLFYFKLDDYEAAIQEFKIAIALSPNAASSASFYNNLGLVYLRIHRYNWAISCFNIAIDKAPNFVDYYINFVKACKAKKQLDSVISRYNKMLKKDKDDYIAWLVLGLAYKEQSKNAQALKCFDEFKKSGPDDLLLSAVDNIIRSMSKN